MNEIRRYNVNLVGVSDCLMHANDVAWNDQVTAFVKVKENRERGKAGDDRCPAWKWLGYCYHDAECLGVPSDNLMAIVRDASKKIILKGKQTYKNITQSGLVVDQIQWPLLLDKGGQLVGVPWPELAKLLNENNFSAHEEAAKELGFELFTKAAMVQGKKHIRVRPRFSKWSAHGTISVFDDLLTDDILEEIFRIGGLYCGFGDWRPVWGKFEAKLTKI